MASISTHQKSKEEVKECKNEEDRISNLPKSLISHILSFLPTKYAVRTSVLSTKWKLNWQSVTNIDIDDEEPFEEYSSVPVLASFMNFVYRVLLLCRVAHMHKFRLRCCQNVHISHVNLWVASALARNVQEFDLFIHLKQSGFVSRDLLTCRNLVVLKLGTGFLLNVPDSVCFPSLKILHICHLKFSDDESLNRLFLGCPLLEELRMEGPVGADVSVVKISAPLLKRLIIYNLCGIDYDNEVFEYKIVFDTPNLLYLECKDYVTHSYSGQKLNHLVKALLYFVYNDDHWLGGNYIIYKQATTDFFEAISKVQVLQVCAEFLQQIIANYRPQLPIFQHATYLEFSGTNIIFGNVNVRGDMLPDLLQYLPSLETLVFKVNVLYKGNREEDNVPSCYLFSLKVIELWEFRGMDGEIKMVKYFLKNARVLKKLTLHTSFRSQSEELKATKALLMLPRRSMCCQVEFL